MKAMWNSVEPQDIAKRFKLSLPTVTNKENLLNNGYHQLNLINRLLNSEKSYEFYPTLAQINRTREYHGLPPLNLNRSNQKPDKIGCHLEDEDLHIESSEPVVIQPEELEVPPPPVNTEEQLKFLYPVSLLPRRRTTPMLEQKKEIDKVPLANFQDPSFASLEAEQVPVFLETNGMKTTPFIHIRNAEDLKGFFQNTPDKLLAMEFSKQLEQIFLKAEFFTDKKIFDMVKIEDVSCFRKYPSMLIKVIWKICSLGTNYQNFIK